ncbi:MAG: outer membrane protein transport protein [Bacteroidales bacterium]|nr:outer membrane protein transport protein [Bacteroidales bacterium]
MKKSMRKLWFAIMALLMICLIYTPDANATDGYFSNGTGTKSKGMAGAGIAYLKGPFGGALNPAGISFLEKKWSFEVSVGLFNPNRKYTVTGAATTPDKWGYMDQNGTFVNDPRFMAFGLAEGTVESDKKYFVIPAIAFSYKIGDKHNLGFNFYGNGGMNTTYETKTYYSEIIDGFGNPMPDGNPNPMANVSQPTGINMQQMFISLTYAIQLGKHSIGVSPVFVYQTFEATGLQAFRDMGMAGSPQLTQMLGTPDRMNSVTNNGVDNSTGFGVKIGYQGELFDGFRLGASFQPKIKMSKFDKYAGLFAEEGGFDIPCNWQAGVSYTVADKVTIMFDVKRIMYSKVKSIANPMKPQEMMPMVPTVPMDPQMPFQPNPGWVPLGDENGAGFGWEDLTVFKLGVEVAVVKTWQFRTGVSYGKEPIQQSEVMFNILAPAVNNTHLSLGFTKEIKDHALNFAVTHALNNKVSGPNPFDPAQTIDLEMNQWEFELGFRF